MRKRTKEVNAHRMVAKLCSEMANKIFDELCTRSNLFYAANPDRREFVNRCAPTLVVEARGILASMLGMDSVSDPDKAAIFEALQLDSLIPMAHERAKYALQ